MQEAKGDGIPDCVVRGAAGRQLTEGAEVGADCPWFPFTKHGADRTDPKGGTKRLRDGVDDKRKLRDLAHWVRELVCGKGGRTGTDFIGE